MDKPFIFLDMDGVIVDFVNPVFNIFGIKHPIGKWETYLIQDLLGYENREEDFWDAIERFPDFWETLPAYPWIDDIMEACAAYGNTIILSKPTLDPGSAAGKVAWLQRQFGRGFRDYLIGAPKHTVAHPGAILVDDSDENVKAFQAHGGFAYLFGQPWNAIGKTLDDPAGHLRFYLEGAHRQLG